MCNWIPRIGINTAERRGEGGHVGEEGDEHGEEKGGEEDWQERARGRAGARDGDQRWGDCGGGVGEA